MIKSRADRATEIEPSANSSSELLVIVVESLEDIRGELHRSCEILDRIQTLIAEITAKA